MGLQQNYILIPSRGYRIAHRPHLLFLARRIRRLSSPSPISSVGLANRTVILNLTRGHRATHSLNVLHLSPQMAPASSSSRTLPFKDPCRPRLSNHGEASALTTLLLYTIALILFQCWYEAQTWHTRSILSYSFAFWRLTILPHATMYRPRSLGSMHENTKYARCAFDSGPRLVPSQAWGSTLYDDTYTVYTMLRITSMMTKDHGDAVLGDSRGCMASESWLRLCGGGEAMLSCLVI